MDSEKKIIGRCPFCGGNVVKTCKGYRCENNTGEHPSCVLNINAIIGNRKMNDGEIASAGVRTAAARYVWEQGLSTVPTTAIRKHRVHSPSGGI